MSVDSQLIFLIIGTGMTKIKLKGNQMNSGTTIIRKIRQISTIIALGITTIELEASPENNERFKEIFSFLNSKGDDASAFFGVRFSEFCEKLELENVEWNFAYTNFPGGEARIYHFDHFYLYVHLLVLPPSAVFEHPETYSFSSKQDLKNGVRYVAEFSPSIQKDDFSRADLRMSAYWEKFIDGPNGSRNQNHDSR